MRVDLPEPGFWSAKHPTELRPAWRRSRWLLLTDAILVALAIALVRWLIGTVAVPGFLDTPDNVPPLIVDARLGMLEAAILFAASLALVVATASRLWLVSRLTWPWTPLLVAWLGLALAGYLLGSADIAAGVLACGAVPALTIGLNQRYLRHVAGQSPDAPPWTRLRRVLTLVTACVVAVFVVVYFFAAVLQGWRDLPAGVFPFGR
jgi:hypothetical protein